MKQRERSTRVASIGIALLCAVGAVVSAGPAPVLADASATPPPSAPAHVRATTTSTAGAVEVRWAQPGRAAVTAYRVIMIVKGRDGSPQAIPEPCARSRAVMVRRRACLVRDGFYPNMRFEVQAGSRQGWSRRSAPSGTVQAPNLGRLVLNDGDRVRGGGEVVARSGHPTLFCDPDVAIPAAAVRGDDAPNDCPIHIRIKGVDLKRLSDRQKTKSGVTGNATVSGIYRHGTLTVTEQKSYVFADPQTGGPDTVPCQAPPGGWPVGGPVNLSTHAVRKYASQHKATAVMIALLRPGPRQVLMYLLTSGNTSRARAALEPAYGKRLCIGRSLFTPAQLHRAERVTNHLFDQSAQSLLTSPTEAGLTLTPGEQALESVSVPTLDERTLRTVRSAPTGLIQLDLWLVPTG